MRNLKFGQSLNVLFLGDSRVGKTALIENFVNHRFPQYYEPTIETDFSKCDVTTDDITHTLQIWDTPGQQALSDLKATLWQKLDVAILAYSVDNKLSFENIEKLHGELNKHSTKILPIILVALKTDLIPRLVIKEQGIALGRKLGIAYCECSAKTSAGVQEVFLAAMRTKISGIRYTRSELLEKEENKILKKGIELLKAKLATAEELLNKLYLKNIDVKKVIRAQAFFRGFKARKDYEKIKNIKKEAQRTIKRICE